MEPRKSPRSRKQIQSELSSDASSDDDVSSRSKSTTNSKRTSPKKIKRANRKDVVHRYQRHQDKEIQEHQPSRLSTHPYYLVKQSIINVPAGTPRVKFLMNDIIDELEFTCHKRGRDDEQLFESILDEEKLSKYPLVEPNNVSEQEESDSNDQEVSTQQDEGHTSRRRVRIASHSERCTGRSSKRRRSTTNEQETSNIQKAFSEAKCFSSKNIEQMKTYYKTDEIQHNIYQWIYSGRKSAIP
ncbi:uncharacterized protein [Triticum aestivum]|uniref:uncharacterized protein isoform X2 n=1 Tax=Triticum aestivum TaxID=4565 RepID=UPI001D01ECD0|nr:uncharacterized protein LOC123120014 isoform X2 [Triticum aestivum]